MALTVQDDNGSVAGANSYVTVAEFKAYHTDRGNAFTATDSAIEKALVGASDYLDTRFSYIGKRLRGREQTTEWPRYNAFDKDDVAVSGIPVEVKEAVAEYALRALDAPLNADPVQDGIVKITKKLDPMESTIEYDTELLLEFPEYPAADLKLTRAGLVKTRTTGNVYRG